MPFVQAYTRSSGYCIGGANWTVSYKGHRTAFISTSAINTCLHPQEYDASCVSEAQAIVYCDVQEVVEMGEAENAQVVQRVNQLCSTAIATIKQRGRVMLIGEPYGVTQDVLQAVIENCMAMNVPLPQVVVVSSVGERTLQYGNIMGEWLCASKQALLYLPEYPFLDKELRLKNHLHFVPSLTALSRINIPQGSWFVVVPPSDTQTIDHFLRQWTDDAKTCSTADRAAMSGMAKFSVLIHEDDTRRAQSLVDRLSATTELTYCPVSRRFTPHTVEQSLRSAERAQHVVVPSHVHAYLRSSASNTASDWEFALSEYSHLSAAVVTLDTDRHLPLSIQGQLTEEMRAQKRQHSLVEGRLLLDAGGIRLVPVVKESAKPGSPPLVSAVDVPRWSADELASELGAVGVVATADQESVRVSVPGGSAVIRVESGRWMVDCSSPSAQWVVFDSLKRLLKA
ncbi:Integrator complex subunit 9 [Linderina macrospora]|uniref:Integrator complex subunit 9 n=1 Tax=Linderina macrospora TaxID=4868 RepID=A0ACC1J8Y9_9FUNG|nr:Integrator complex subunit 9 [Linderina macrospora]